jgi:mannose-1-phosphate guanylyltransferase
MKRTALIMAGGRGERFWPKSRKNLPKQFLSLTDDGKTMIQLTVERILPLVAIEDIYIVTNSGYYSLVLEQLPNLPASNILCEPVGRNTAPCIGLGAVHISKKYDDAIMMVLPSDHIIKYNTMFVSTLREACKVAEQDKHIVTVGITPDCPETGYGYIKFNPNKTQGAAFAVERIVEKPSLEVAKEYLASEEYLWNSGMFVWKVSTILNNIQKYMPDIYEGLTEIKNSLGTSDAEFILDKTYKNFRNESVDYGIMEKATDIFILPGTFGWDDVGSWLAIERINKTNEYGNAINGNVITIDSRNCIIEGERKLVAAVGLKDLIIVDTSDAILICAKDSTTSIKKILENLKICNRDEYL